MEARWKGRCVKTSRLKAILLALPVAFAIEPTPWLEAKSYLAFISDSLTSTAYGGLYVFG